MSFAPAQSFSPGSILSDIWDTARGTFQRWADHELGLSDIALEQEAQASAARIAADTSPVQDHTANVTAANAQTFNTTLLLGVAGAGLLLLLLLKN